MIDCWWSRWINPDKDKPDLLSFALITVEPPADVPPEATAAASSRSEKGISMRGSTLKVI